MNRLLATFLALLAGLLAQGGPAQAGECRTGASQVGAMEAPLEQVVVSAQVQVRTAPRTPREEPAMGQGFSQPVAMSVLVPTVRLGPDRAHE